MKVILDTNIDNSHLTQLFDALKDIELKEGSLSLLQFVYPKETLEYSIWHNKKSFTINSRTFPRGDE